MAKTCNCCDDGEVKYVLIAETHVKSLDGNLDYYLSNPDIDLQYYCQKHMEELYET